MQLADLKPGQSARILNMSALAPAVRRRLMVMGLLPQSEIRVIRSAPFGDPLQIATASITLSVQKQLALDIEVASL